MVKNKYNLNDMVEIYNEKYRIVQISSGTLNKESKAIYYMLYNDSTGKRLEMKEQQIERLCKK